MFMSPVDGLTIRATYKDGVLDRLETRGNGIVGTDITYHKNSFVNIPLKIKEKGEKNMQKKFTNYYLMKDLKYFLMIEMKNLVTK